MKGEMKMLITKGMSVKTKNNTIWYVRETQKTSQYLKVESKDGFQTIVDINEVKLYR